MAVSLTLTPTMGVDKSASAANIADNALSRGYNVYYDPGTSKLTTRPGFKCVTTSALPEGIDALQHFGGMNGTTAFSCLMCVSAGILYKLSGMAWDEVATLESETPQMVILNSNLGLAPGGKSLFDFGFDGKVNGVNQDVYDSLSSFNASNAVPADFSESYWQNKSLTHPVVWPGEEMQLPDLSWTYPQWHAWFGAKG